MTGAPESGVSDARETTAVASHGAADAARW
jgi:hypothetical protein